MIEYKTVAGPARLVITQSGDYDSAVRQYADILTKEAAGGWELVCIQEIPVTTAVGCLASLLGRKSTTTYFNMLVFKRDTNATRIEEPHQYQEESAGQYSDKGFGRYQDDNAGYYQDADYAEEPEHSGNIFCPYCGGINDSDSRFCESCGKLLK